MGVRFDSWKKEKLELVALIIKHLCKIITPPCTVAVLYLHSVRRVHNPVQPQSSSKKNLFSRKKYVTDLGAFTLSSLIWLLRYCFGEYNEQFWFLLASTLAGLFLFIPYPLNFSYLARVIKLFACDFFSLLWNNYFFFLDFQSDRTRL